MKYAVPNQLGRALGPVSDKRTASYMTAFQSSPVKTWNIVMILSFILLKLAPGKLELDYSLLVSPNLFNTGNKVSSSY